MTSTGAATVRKQIVVDAPIERAFTVFTDRFGDFKPPEHNLLADRYCPSLGHHASSVGASAASTYPASARCQ